MAKIKITNSRDCFKCPDGCCRFRNEDRPYAPIFTDAEIKKIRKIFKLPRFKSYKRSKKVYQVILLKSKKEKGIYICPYFNEIKKSCKIYYCRPFDCEFWPFILMKNKSGKRSEIRLYDKSLCFGLQKMSAKKINGHKKRMVRLLHHKNFLNLIDTYPELIWDYDPETKFVAKQKNIS
jgi:Fe-S-cluster containining protein